MILRMIATGSLSAFSASVLNGTGALQPNGATPALGGQRPIAGGPIQAVRAAQPQPLPQVQPALDLGRLSTTPAGRVPPRGSLLDLSV